MHKKLLDSDQYSGFSAQRTAPHSGRRRNSLWAAVTAPVVGHALYEGVFCGVLGMVVWCVWYGRAVCLLVVTAVLSAEGHKVQQVMCFVPATPSPPARPEFTGTRLLVAWSLFGSMRWWWVLEALPHPPYKCISR